MSVRRYLTIVQAPEGYPAPKAPLEDAPSVPQPMLHSVVLADDYEALEARVDALTGALRETHRQLGRYEDKGPKQISRALLTIEEAVPDLRPQWVADMADASSDCRSSQEDHDG